MSSFKGDRVLLYLFLTLVTFGFFIFISASLSVYVRDVNLFYSILFGQLVLGLLGGTVAFFVGYFLPYKVWLKTSPYIFIAALILMILVFVPHVGFAHNGAKRWIHLLGISFQPAEFLKFAYAAYFAAWLYMVKDKVKTLRAGMFPFLLFIGIIAALLIKQPDTGTFSILFFAGFAMYIYAGAPLRHVAAIFLASGTGLFILTLMRPYLKARFMTLLDPSIDPLGSGFQINQASIALGSGGLFGKGFGQSFQKFGYLPESLGDSIFAVFGEEFGFLGTMFFIALLVAVALRGLRVVKNTHDVFGRLLALGIVILIVSQSFINIASMVGLFPLTGVPLVFVSQGGTALLIALFEMGVLLNISKNRQST